MSVSDMTFINKKGEKVSGSALNGKVVGFYFSAHWCPPCRGFTPVLADFYNKAKAAGLQLEIIFVSHDRSEQDMNNYFHESHADYLALPFDAAVRQDLPKKYSIRGIPTLVIVNNNGEGVHLSARGDVTADADVAAVFQKWKSLC